MTPEQQVNAKFREVLRNYAYKHCFINFPKECENKTINAHSISDKKYLSLISDEGHVLMPSMDTIGGDFLVKKGRKAASTFPGMCDVHDKIYRILDQQNYEAGDKEFEFLCAFRAVAREWYAKKSQYSHAETLPSLISDPFYRAYADSVLLGVKDNERERDYFNHLLRKKRYKRITTLPLIFEGCTPIALSTMFSMQVDFDGNLINDLSDTSTHPALTYMTILPDQERTIVLLSCRTDELEKLKTVYKKIQKSSVDDQKMIITNIIAGFVENFAISPKYWSSLKDATKKKFQTVFQDNIAKEIVPLVSDRSLNIFV